MGNQSSTQQQQTENRWNLIRAIVRFQTQVKAIERTETVLKREMETMASKPSPSRTELERKVIELLRKKKHRQRLESFVSYLELIKDKTEHALSMQQLSSLMKENNGLLEKYNKVLNSKSTHRVGMDFQRLADQLSTKSDILLDTIDIIDNDGSDDQGNEDHDTKSIVDSLLQKAALDLSTQLPPTVSNTRASVQSTVRLNVSASESEEHKS